MKKLFTIALSLVMVFSMTAVSFAADTTYTDQSEVTITKTYEATNTGTTSPAETFTFSTLTCTNVEDAGVGVTTANAPVPTIGSVSYAAGEAGSAAQTKNITITLPVYTAVGVYTYTFNEIASTNAGVDCHQGDIILKVTVIQDGDNKLRIAGVHTEASGAAKSSSITNIYKAGSLAVTKKVTGNMGDRDKDFNVTVTFTAPAGKTVNSTISYTDGTDKEIVPSNWSNGKATAEITLKHDETVTFTNIPYGVTYTVVEDDYTTEANGKYDAAKYIINPADDTKIGDADGNGINGAIDSASDLVKITNNKQRGIDTGIFFDNGIYIAILAIVLIAAAAFIIRRRQHRYDA